MNLSTKLWRQVSRRRIQLFAYLLPLLGLTACLDNFNRPDSPLHNSTSTGAQDDSNEWIDFNSIYPNQFEPAAVISETLGTGGQHFAQWPTEAGCAMPTAPDPLDPKRVAHLLAYQEGVTIDGEPISGLPGIQVSVEWLTPPTTGLETTKNEELSMHNIHQVSPLIFAAPTTNPAVTPHPGRASDKRLGLSNFFDVSFFPNAAPFYALAAFRSPEHHVFWQGYYEYYDLNHHTVDIATWTAEPSHTVAIRTYGGMMEGRFDGERVWGPVPVPSWALGRDGVGIHVIDIFLPTDDNAAMIDNWVVRKWEEPLGSYPASVQAIAGPVATGNGSSFRVYYPNGVSPDDQFILLVAKNSNSNLPAPAGFFGTGSIEHPGSSSLRVHAYESSNRANGSENSSQYVTLNLASGSADYSAMMLVLKNVHPRLRYGFLNNPIANEFTTGTSQSPTHPGLLPNGPYRTGLWVAAVDGSSTGGSNLAVTPPAGFQTVRSTWPNGGQSDINLIVASDILPFTGPDMRCRQTPPSMGPPQPIPNQTTPLVGTMPVSLPWVTAARIQVQDPR